MSTTQELACAIFEDTAGEDFFDVSRMRLLAKAVALIPEGYKHTMPDESKASTVALFIDNLFKAIEEFDVPAGESSFKYSNIQDWQRAFEPVIESFLEAGQSPWVGLSDSEFAEKHTFDRFFPSLFNIFLRLGAERLVSKALLDPGRPSWETMMQLPPTLDCQANIGNTGGLPTLENAEVGIRGWHDMSTPTSQAWVSGIYVISRCVNANVISCFLQAGMPVDMSDCFGNTMLFYADENTAEWLLEKGADPLARNKFGQTALDYKFCHNLSGENQVIKESMNRCGAFIKIFENAIQTGNENKASSESVHEGLISKETILCVLREQPEEHPEGPDKLAAILAPERMSVVSGSALINSMIVKRCFGQYTGEAISNSKLAHLENIHLENMPLNDAGDSCATQVPQTSLIFLRFLQTGIVSEADSAKLDLRDAAQMIADIRELVSSIKAQATTKARICKGIGINPSDSAESSIGGATEATFLANMWALKQSMEWNDTVMDNMMDVLSNLSTNERHAWARSLVGCNSISHSRWLETGLGPGAKAVFLVFSNYYDACDFEHLESSGASMNSAPCNNIALAAAVVLANEIFRQQESGRKNESSRSVSSVRKNLSKALGLCDLDVFKDSALWRELEVVSKCDNAHGLSDLMKTVTAETRKRAIHAKTEQVTTIDKGRKPKQINSLRL